MAKTVIPARLGSLRETTVQMSLLDYVALGGLFGPGVKFVESDSNSGVYRMRVTFLSESSALAAKEIINKNKQIVQETLLDCAE